jgi:hypothetical protein
MTDGPEKKSVEHLLALYVDNELEPQERAEFEKAMDVDPLLRAEVELQNRIDASLRSAFDAANVAHIETSAQAGRRSPLLRRVAAVLFFAISMGVVYWQYRSEFGSRPASDSPTYAVKVKTMQAYYDEAIASGFEPGWVCSGEQFESTFRSRFGQRIVLDNLPANVKISGLGYANIRTAQTVSVYARVDNQPVLLFVEPASATGELSPMSEGFYRHERAMGRLLIYEVSQFQVPQILDYISVVKCKKQEGD